MLYGKWQTTPRRERCQKTLANTAEVTSVKSMATATFACRTKDCTNSSLILGNVKLPGAFMNSERCFRSTRNSFKCSESSRPTYPWILHDLYKFNGYLERSHLVAAVVYLTQRPKKENARSRLTVLTIPLVKCLSDPEPPQAKKFCTSGTSGCKDRCIYQAAATAVFIRAAFI